MNKDLSFTVRISSAGLAGDPHKLYVLEDTDNDIQIHQLFNQRSRTSSFLSMTSLIKTYNYQLTRKGVCADGLKYVKIRFDKSSGYHKIISNEEPTLDIFHQTYS